MINQTLEAMASPDDIPPSLEADFVVLRKLRDDDASGVLTFNQPLHAPWYVVERSLVLS